MDEGPFAQSIDDALLPGSLLRVLGTEMNHHWRTSRVLEQTGISGGSAPGRSKISEVPGAGKAKLFRIGLQALASGANDAATTGGRRSDLVMPRAEAKRRHDSDDGAGELSRPGDGRRMQPMA